MISDDTLSPLACLNDCIGRAVALPLASGDRHSQNVKFYFKVFMCWAKGCYASCLDRHCLGRAIALTPRVGGCRVSGGSVSKMLKFYIKVFSCDWQGHVRQAILSHTGLAIYISACVISNY